MQSARCVLTLFCQPHRHRSVAPRAPTVFHLHRAAVQLQINTKTRSDGEEEQKPNPSVNKYTAAYRTRLLETAMAGYVWRGRPDL
uniref:Uncharacterized protein n=1 Tax=Oryza brachyantha TaxID=4533 RepID=J3MXH4_ORYBR